jgi:LuxR family transcriptional regulator, maltose regulon positive regulatory protein
MREGKLKMEYVLATKMYAPATQPYHVRRENLEERITKGLYGKLTLISAPAGFGKTMLMSEFINILGCSAEYEDKRAVAWVSLDSDDNSTTRFLTYLCASLVGCGVLSQSFYRSAEQIINTPNVPHFEILTALINELASVRKKAVLFLDDFHCIESQKVFDLVTFLIEHSPDWFHLVISTRDDPRLPLARLRARGQLNEFRAIDLRFRTEEITSLLKQIGAPEMNLKERQSLESISEGWITGILLAVISARNPTLLEKNRYALDYLMAEVLIGLSDDVRDFLVRISFLDRFSPELCTVVSESEEAEAAFDNILKSNLFLISLDGEGIWYRYHHLFRELLHDLFKELPEDEQKAYLKSAGRWFLEQELLDEALEYLIAAEDWDNAAGQLETYSIDGSSQSIVIWKWLEAIPDEVVSGKPDLCILKAWRFLTAGRAKEAGNCLADASRLMVSLKMEAKAFDRIAGRSFVIRAFIESYEGNLKGTIEHAAAALVKLSPADKVWRAIASIALGDSVGMSGNMDKALEKRFEALDDCEKAGNLYLILLSSVKLAVTLRLRGDLSQVRELCLKYVSLAEGRHLSGLPIVGWLKSILAEILAETGELEEAMELGIKAVKQTILPDDVAMYSWSRLCMARIRFVAGEFKEVEFLIREMEETMMERIVPPYIDSSLSAWKIRLLLRMGRIEEAAAQCRKRKLSAGSGINSFNANEYISYARMLMETNKIEDCRALLSKLQNLAQECGWLFRKIEILLIRSLLAQKTGSSQEAKSLLKEALLTGQAQGFHAIYISEGEALTTLLRTMREDPDTSDFAEKLLTVEPVDDKAQTFNLAEPLSVREIEVLKYLSEGLSRQQIADTLFLSPHTIKAHLRNIYGKLDVNSSIQAIAKARLYELIS